MATKNIKEVIREHANELIALPGVTGVGEGRADNEPCILVFVEDKKADSISDIPQNIEGFSVMIVESEAFRSFGSERPH